MVILQPKGGALEAQVRDVAAANQTAAGLFSFPPEEKQPRVPFGPWTTAEVSVSSTLNSQRRGRLGPDRASS